MVVAMIRLGRVRPDAQSPAQIFLCMEVVPYYLTTPPPPKRARQAQLPKTSVRPTTGIVVY